jgi:hypothetical protein
MPAISTPLFGSNQRAAQQATALHQRVGARAGLRALDGDVDDFEAAKPQFASRSQSPSTGALQPFHHQSFVNHKIP